jgi:hypothetical protein
MDNVHRMGHRKMVSSDTPNLGYQDTNMTPAHEIVRKSQASEHIRCHISFACPDLGHDGDQPKSESEHPFWVEHGEFSQYGSLLYS